MSLVKSSARLRMDKEKTSKKLTFKKAIVRNPEQSKPKTVVILQPEMPGPSGISHKTLSEEQTCSAYNELSAKEVNSKLKSPELNSALRIVKKIESIESIKPKKVKSISDLDKKKQLILDERASKQLNFPYYQNIYKDLIPLCVKSQPPTLPAISREVLLHRDKEPQLSDFFTPRILPEYSFQVPVQGSHKTLSKQFDGLKLYRTMRNWD